MAVVGAVLLLALRRNLRRVRVQHDALRGVDGLRFGNPTTIDQGQPGEILFLSQHRSLERLQPGGQRRPALDPSLLEAGLAVA